MTWSGCRLNSCQYPTGPQISFGKFFFQKSKLRETSPRVWQVLARIDIPVVVNSFFLHDVQISASRFCYVPVLQVNRECFFLKHIELNSRFIAITIDEVTLNRPEVGTGFSVIGWFCRLRLPAHLEVLHWSLRPLQDKEDSPPSAFWSSVSNSALDLSSALGIRTSSTNRLFPLEIITSDVHCLPLGDGIAISSPYWSRIFKIWTSMTGPKIVPIIVPPANAVKALDSGFTRKRRVFSASLNDLPKTVVLVRSSFVAHTSWYPVSERCKFGNTCESNCHGQWFEALNVFPETVSTYQSWKRYQKFYFVWFHACRYTYGHGFFLFFVPFLPLSSRTVHTNSKLLR